jgi:hypothetical protein
MKIFTATGGTELLFSRNREKYFYVLNSKSPAHNFYINNIPKRNIISIDYQKHRAGAFYDREIVSFRNLSRMLKEKNINAFWPFDKPSLHLQRWAAAKEIKLLAPKWDLQKKLENKVFFEKLLRKNRISSPHGWILENPDDIKKISEYPAVLQIPYSQGSRGTFIVKNANEIKKVIRDKELKFPLLCRKFIHGIPMGVTLLIGKHDMIFSSARMQLVTKGLKGYIGIKWVRSDFFAKPLLEELNKIMLSLGKNLQKIGFTGAANIDFIANDKDIFILECNPRLSLSSIQLTDVKGLFHGLDFIEEFIKTVCGERLSADKPEIPDTDFEGCTLDLDFFGKQLHELKAKNPLKAGIYSLKNKKIIYQTDRIDKFHNKNNIFIYSALAKNQLMTKKTDFGFLMMNQSIFKTQSDLEFQKNGREFFNALKNLFSSIV